ncbi:hypothetical protein [Enterococcus gallinarum]|uniref:hypothetical protein n=1 Tax=Enterococcus gallinarum TaxID=1353 RepID=UPI0027E1F5C4|nr:hypothetical protein [Enterococcus gallinarum]MDQ6110491.1 hypothetical protein [Enterococcus gallinarum]
MKKRKYIKRLVLCFISLVTLAALISIQHVYADGTEVQLVIHCILKTLLKMMAHCKSRKLVPLRVKH